MKENGFNSSASTSSSEGSNPRHETDGDNNQTRDSLRDYVQVLDSHRDYVQVLDSLRDYIQVLDSHRDYVQVLDSHRDYVQVLDSLRDYVQVLDSHRDYVQVLDSHRDYVQSWTMSQENRHEGDQAQSTQSTQSPSQAQSTQSTQSSSQAQSTQSTQSPSQAQSTQSPSQAKSQSQPGSSSSSGPTSASQSSSGSGTLSSVDTLPVTLPSVPEEPEPQPWGRLLPMARGFRSHDCLEDQYLFGRDSKCNYVLDDPDHRGSKKFRIYSKRHFRIYRDFSNNGTFVDGVLIGKDRKLPLVNNAVLALSEQRNKVFVFIDLMSDDQSSLPRELQDKYLLTRRIGTGVCGEVKLAFERSTCKKFAVKIINKKNFQSEGTATRNAKTEIEILQRVDHPCLIKTEDFYQTDDSYYIVLEL
ncbi:Serine/threonine-protein kinase Chk2 [Nibea albiflora]|nr:Serine/threonine-protein kinase Chk2 [Nibea albiflora]